MTGGDVQWQQAGAASYTATMNRIYPAQFVSAVWSGRSLVLSSSFRFEWFEKIPVYGLALEKALFRNIVSRSSVQNHFRRPTMNDLNWGSAKPRQLLNETGNAAETGLFHKIEKNRLYVENGVGLFYRSLKNAIVWMPDGALWKPVNNHLSQFSGIDVQSSMRLNLRKMKWSLVVNYEFVKSMVWQSDGEAAKPKIFVPQHSGNAAMGMNYKKLTLKINSIYTGMRFTSTDGYSFLPGYFLFNSNLFYDIKYDKYAIVCAVSCDNIADISYQSMPGRPMPGRSFQVSVTIKYNQ